MSPSLAWPKIPCVWAGPESGVSCPKVSWPKTHAKIVPPSFPKGTLSKKAKTAHTGSENLSGQFPGNRSAPSGLAQRAELANPAGIGIAVLAVTTPVEAGCLAGLTIVPGLLWLLILRNGKVGWDSILPGSTAGQPQQSHFVWLQMSRVLSCFS